MKEKMTEDLLQALRAVRVREVFYHPEQGFCGASPEAVETLLEMELIADIDRLNGVADFFLTPEGVRALEKLER